MKDNKELLYKTLNHFNGISKVEAYDLIHKLETLMFYASNPINTDDLEKKIISGFDHDYEIDPFYFTILPTGNFCEYIGHNDWLHVYKENKRMIPDWSIFETYYFKTKYAPLELRKLTKNKLLQDIKEKPEEEKIKHFLKNTAILKKDTITNNLLILKV
ncbi:hypothetical protein [Aquimarina longa]|uniref:hypothetical protein n=1 Tax=Aquimarina longa TaxID=1080221 RepID=UPI0007853D2F|nr:hypothetical protein [Aquimarina longa]